MKKTIVIGCALGVLFSILVFLTSTPFIIGSGNYLVYASSSSQNEQTYSVFFTASGLPSGTTWTIILNSVYMSSYSNSITFNLPNGVYDFSIPEVGGWPSGYVASPSVGSLTVNGENINIQVAFTPSTQDYLSTFLPLFLIIIPLFVAAITLVVFRRKIALIIYKKRKGLRYLRWTSKAAFLLFFMLPIAYLVGVPWRPVYSLFFGVSVGAPYLKVPITQSVCIIWTTSSMTNIDPGAWIVCPLGSFSSIISGMVDSFRIAPTLIAIFIFIILIILLGNVFCSWVCPLGTLVDSFDKSVEKFLPKIDAKRSMRSIKSKQKKNEHGTHVVCPSCVLTRVLSSKVGILAYGILGATFVSSFLFNLPVFCLICPMGIISRGIMHLKAISMTLPTARVTGQYLAFVPELVIVPVAAVLLSLREKRFWCRKLCPLGALLSTVGTLNPFIKPKLKPSKCIMKGCPEDCKDHRSDYCLFCFINDDKKCEKVCPVDIDLVSSGSLNRCTKCMECYIVCDRNAITIDLVGKPDISRIGRLFKNLSARITKKHV